MSPIPSADDRFSHLQSLMLSTDDITTILTELATLATSTASTPMSCSFTLRYTAGILSVGTSDERAELLDETQYHARVGPCLHSMRSSTTVHIADIEVEPRWPEYITAARRQGLRSSLSLPLALRGDTFGAMNVYNFDTSDVFGATTQRQLELYAAQATGTLYVAVRQVKNTALLQQMEESLASRTTIDQALGIIMATQSCTASTAFELLRQQSQNTRQRLRHIAEDLIGRTSGQPPEPGRPFDPT